MDKHKWNKEIVAWANGNEIECRLIDFNATSNDWGTVYHPQWDNPSIEFRIKPKEESITIEVGKFYKTRDDYKVIVYAIYEEKEWYRNIHGAYLNKNGWVPQCWFAKGNFFKDEDHDLDIVAEWTEPHPAESWEVDKRILVSREGVNWFNAHFSSYKKGKVHVWAYGATSWTTKTDQGIKEVPWKFAKPAEEEEL